MSNGQTKIFGLSLYLDIWRGAFYSVMIGSIYQATVFKSSKSLFLFFVAVFITIYLVLDGITRYNSRELVRGKYSGTKKKMSENYEVFWLIFEMLGLLIFAVWVYYISALDPNIQINLSEILTVNYELIGIFCLLNFFHNTLIINSDKNIRFWEFTKISFLSDASEIENVSEKWGKYLIKLKEKLLLSLDDAYSKFEDSIRSFRIIDESKNKKGSSFLPEGFPEPIWKYIILLFVICKLAIRLGTTHLLIQYVALHLFIFNLIIGILIIYLPMDGIFLHFLIQQNLYLALFLIIFLSVIFYSVSSVFEMKRFKSKQKEKNFCEKISQFFGNSFLVIFLLILIVSLSKFVLISLLLMEGGLFAFLLIVLTKNPQV